MNLMRICRTFGCLLTGGAVFLSSVVSAGVLYQKDYVIKQDHGQRIWCEPYRVQKNDSLLKLFQEKGEIIDENRDEFLGIFKDINSWVKDIESIPAGRLIYIPLKKLGPERGFSSQILTLPMVTVSGKDVPTKTDTGMKDKISYEFVDYKIKPGDTLSAIISQQYGVSEGSKFKAILRRLLKENPGLNNPARIRSGRVIRMPIYEPAEPSLSISAGMLEKVSGQFHARLVRDSVAYFPMPGKNDFKLDMARFPVMELPDGRRILLNPGNGLTEADKEVIRRFWSGVVIADVAYDVASDDLVRQIVALAPELEKRIEKSRPSDISGPASSPLSSDQGMLIPVHDMSQLVDVLMRTLAVPYSRNVEVNFPYAGMQIISQSNLIESGHGKPILVDFGSFYGDAVQSLEKNGFRVFQVQNTDSIGSGISNLLNALGIPFSVDPLLQVNQQSRHIPGIYIPNNGKPVLVSDAVAANVETVQALLKQGMVLICLNR